MPKMGEKFGQNDWYIFAYLYLNTSGTAREIYESIAEASKGTWKPTFNTIKSSVRRLRVQAFISTDGSGYSGYRLSDKGARAFASQRKRMSAMLSSLPKEPT